MSGAKHHQVWGFSSAGLGPFFAQLYPRDTASHVASVIGAPVRSVENWLDQTAAPSLRWLMPMIGAFGPGVLAALFPPEQVPGWVRAEVRAQAKASAAEQILRLQRLIEDGE